MEFKSFAAAYDHFSGDNAYNAQYERPAMRALLPEDLRGVRILDAGCAVGYHAAWMQERGARVVAVDNDPSMVELARRRLGEDGRVVLADLAKPLAFLDEGSVDLVFCSLTMHYLADWQSVFAEFHRVLVRGGRLLFSTHHPCADQSWGGSDYFAVERLTQVWSEFGPREYPMVFYRRPLSSMIADLGGAGFQIEKVVEPRPQPQMRQTAPETFAKLSRHPWFILFQAVRVDSGFCS
ncbi:MAG: class I SAM-dependent methyltransferase [Magnetococcales bacterium]|nr:class I SAM-dependent methyltransferase [Magnetococcales bacterium]